MEERKMKKSTKYLVIGVLVLFLSILGASVAYYLARVSGNLSGRAAGTELTINVEKLSTNANMDLIPLDNDLETLNQAAAGYDDKGACVDINGYSVCQIYKVTVTNKGSVPLTMNGTVTLSGQNIPNIDCARMDNVTTVSNNNSCKGSNIFVSGDTLAANSHNDYYVMVYINNLDEPQTDSGEFNGTITFTTEDGRKVKGRFTKPFNLVEHIEELYNNDTKKTVTANSEAEFDRINNVYNVTKTIDYNYAENVSLMRDRFGSENNSINSGNLRYYGPTPNNYIDIGDKTEIEIKNNNWEKLFKDFGEPAPFNDSTECNNFFNCSLNYSELGFESEEECNNNINEMSSEFLTYSGYSTIGEFCSTTTIPVGTPILWRIVGIFDNGLKIVRDESIGNYSYDYTSSQWGNIEDYNGANLMKLLNPGYENNQDLNSSNETIKVNNSLYWNSNIGTCYSGENYSTINCDFTATGLSNEAKENIIKTTWNLGAIPSTEDKGGYPNVEYTYEHGNVALSNTNVPSSPIWNGYIGLLSMSDFLYAGNLDLCKKVTFFIETDECANSNWIYNTSEYNQYVFTFSKELSGFTGAIKIQDNGIVKYFMYTVSKGGAIKPSAYIDLLSLVESGNGTKANPYVLAS